MKYLDFNNILSVSIPILAAILGIAFPIIVQTIGSIDERYNSTRLVKKFKKEPIYLFFQLILIFNIVVTIYNITVFLPWKGEWGGLLNKVMGSSSDIIVLFSTITLITLLFLLIKLIIRYYDYIELFKYVRKKLYKNNNIKTDLIKNEGDIYDFIELAKYIVRKDANDDSIREFYQFLYDYSVWEVTKKESLDGDFDDWFYDGIISLNDVICKENLNPISIVNGNDIVKLLIPSFKPEYVISDKTYLILWRILQHQLFYDRTELVFEYWTCAHQFISLTLKPLNKEYDYNSEKPTVLNIEEVEKRDEQIARFKEFHLALCAMILYNKKYELLKKITSFSQSMPYSFSLIPSSFKDIVYWFEKLNLKTFKRPFYFQQFYRFAGEKGVDAGDVSLGWINRFLTLLLYRLNSNEVQYTIGGLRQWDAVLLPETLKDVTDLLSIVEQMRFFVDKWESSENIKIIDSLGWMPEGKDFNPKEKINQLINDLEDKIIVLRFKMKPSGNKLVLFNNRSLEIIVPAVEVYQEVFKECSSVPSDYEKDIINASNSTHFDKEAFSDDQTISFFDFDEVLAYSVVSEFFRLCFMSVYKRARRSFSIDYNELFDTLDKLIGNKQNDYVVIAYGLYLDYYLDGPNKIDGLIKKGAKISDCYNYNGIEIFNVSSGGHSESDQYVAIIKKEDRPCFMENDAPDETKDKYGFKVPIDQKLKLYTSVLFNNLPDDVNIDINKYCLATIYYCPFLYWKKNADVTILKLLSRYIDSGKGQKVSTLPEL
ncbi:MAG TPA: hypothetical protein GX708_11415 [Gallicola sp.]|nr:hypothetical protein [Gallicola sp.]